MPRFQVRVSKALLLHSLKSVYTAPVLLLVKYSWNQRSALLRSSPSVSLGLTTSGTRRTWQGARWREDGLTGWDGQTGERRGMPREFSQVQADPDLNSSLGAELVATSQC
jgi:hypothetical protein